MAFKIHQYKKKKCSWNNSAVPSPEAAGLEARVFLGISPLGDGLAWCHLLSLLPTLPCDQLARGKWAVSSLYLGEAQ